MKGRLQLRIEPKDGQDAMTLDYNVECERVTGGLLMHKDQKEAVLWDVEVRQCVTSGGGATSLSALMLLELVNSKFLPVQ